MQIIQKLASQAAVYGIANALTAAMPLVLLPIYAQWLQPEDYGIFTLFSTFVVLKVPFIGMGSSAAVQRRYFDLKGQDFANYVNTALTINLCLGLLFCIAGFLPFLFRPDIFGLSGIWVTVASLSATAIVIQQILLAILQSREELRAYAIYQAFCLSLYLGLPVSFLVFFDMGLDGVLAATALAYVIAGIIAFGILCNRGFRPGRPNTEHLKNLTVYGLPLLPHLVAGWVIAMFDRFLIANYWGLSAVGIYAFAFQTAQVLNLLTGSVNQALTPWLYHALNQGTGASRRIVDRVVLLSALLIIIAAILIAVTLHFLVPRMMPQYVASLDFLDWILAGLVLNGMYRIASNFILYRGSTLELAIGTIAAGTASVLANSMLIVKFGPIAAAWTSVLSFAVLFGWTAWRALAIRQLVFGTNK